MAEREDPPSVNGLTLAPETESPGTIPQAKGAPEAGGAAQVETVYPRFPRSTGPLGPTAYEQQVSSQESGGGPWPSVPSVLEDRTLTIIPDGTASGRTSWQYVYVTRPTIAVLVNLAISGTPRYLEARVSPYREAQTVGAGPPFIDPTHYTSWRDGTILFPGPGRWAVNVVYHQPFGDVLTTTWRMIDAANPVLAYSALAPERNQGLAFVASVPVSNVADTDLLTLAQAYRLSSVRLDNMSLNEIQILQASETTGSGTPLRAQGTPGDMMLLERERFSPLQHLRARAAGAVSTVRVHGYFRPSVPQT